MVLGYIRALADDATTDMAENLLESMRRQMRESEGRLKKADEDAARAGLPDGDPQKPVSAPKAGGFESDDPWPEWAAYGQMIPGFLNEIGSIVTEDIQKALIHVQNPDERVEAGWAEGWFSKTSVKACAPFGRPLVLLPSRFPGTVMKGPNPDIRFVHIPKTRLKRETGWTSLIFYPVHA